MTFKPLVLGLLEYLVSSKTNSFMPEPFLIDYLPIITIWWQWSIFQSLTMLGPILWYLCSLLILWDEKLTSDISDTAQHLRWCHTDWGTLRNLCWDSTVQVLALNSSSVWPWVSLSPLSALVFSSEKWGNNTSIINLLWWSNEKNACKTQWIKHRTQWTTEAIMIWDMLSIHQPSPPSPIKSYRI